MTDDAAPQLKLKWKRSHRGNDRYFHALDPDTYGRVDVVNIGQKLDSLGYPAGWWWRVKAPGVQGRQVYPGLKHGEAGTTREAAAEAEAAYFEFLKWIDPEERDYWYQVAEIARAGHEKWCRIHHKHYDD